MMRKHILGLTIFGLILSVSLIAAAIFRFQLLPMPQVFPPEAPRDLIVRIESAQYDPDSRQLTADLKLVWNGPGEAPGILYVRREVVAAGSDSTVTSIEAEKIESPFVDSRTARIRLNSEVAEAFRTENLYLRITDDGSGVFASETSPVLFVHGPRSRNISQK